MDDSDQTVTVVIPYSQQYTPEWMLREAKESVDAQSIPTRVIVVVDEENEGPAAARNVGLDRSDTRYVAFLDADDVWRADKLERQRARMDETSAGLCIDGEPMTRDEFVFELFVGNLNDVMSSILIDTAQVEPRFHEDLVRWEDHLFALEAAATGVCFCPDTFSHRDHAASMTTGPPDRNLYRNQAIRYTSLVAERVPEARPFLYVFYRRAYCLMGIYAHEEGKYRTAAQRFRYSLRIGFSAYALLGLFGSVVLSFVFGENGPEIRWSKYVRR